MRTCHLLLVLLSCLASLTQATLHDRARGLRSQGVSEEDIARYKHHHSSNAGIHRQRPEYKEALKDHPEVNRFMEWRKLHQDGHPAAGAAFAGAIPHDFIHHLMDPSNDHQHTVAEPVEHMMLEL